MGTKAKVTLVAACLAVGPGFLPATSAEPGSIVAMAYDAQTQGAVPIPPTERALQTDVAKPWLKVSSNEMILD